MCAVFCITAEDEQHMHGHWCAQLQASVQAYNAPLPTHPRSAPVTLVLPDDGASCIPSVFLAPLQPVLSFARATAVPARLGGLLLGPRTLNATPNGVSWSQLSLGLLDTSALEGPRRLIAHVGGVRLPGSIDIPLRGYGVLCRVVLQV